MMAIIAQHQHLRFHHEETNPSQIPHIQALNCW
ncbi:hypothetical protein NIES4074_00380 [Cylindrospermum sp. NIES-4074]|nr:hypothetical protein NIES4074_00380 [Cylindrospermum sp. NIES-4074]